MQVRRIELLLIVGVAGLAAAGLCMPTAFHESLFYSITILLVLLAGPMAIGRRGVDRSFWLAFGLTAGAYLFLFVQVQQRPNLGNPLLSSRIMARLHFLIHADHYESPSFHHSGPFGGSGGGDDLFREDDSLFGPPSSDPDLDDLFGVLPASRATVACSSAPILALTISRVPHWRSLEMRVDPDQAYYAFARIGHCCWGLILGWLMGHLAKTVSGSGF